jgi:hypothetical protein
MAVLRGEDRETPGLEGNARIAGRRGKELDVLGAVVGFAGSEPGQRGVANGLLTLDRALHVDVAAVCLEARLAGGLALSLGD